MSEAETATTEARETVTDRELVWVEYLVLCENYDRTLSGGFLESDPETFIVNPESMKDSFVYARRQHQRTIAALGALLGKDIVVEEEADVVGPIHEMGHNARVRLLAGRSVLDELLGPDLFAPEKPS